MATKRTKVPKAAIEAFRQMLQAHDSCTCQDWSCEACERASDLKWTIHCELRLRPWESIAHPDSVCPYPPGTGGATDWPNAQARWLALQEAADGS